MLENNTKTACARCGTCCIKGGPALHFEDRTLLQHNFLDQEHLITIRKGEPVVSPSAVNPEPAQAEIVKIRGKGSDWTCLFFKEEEAACAIYKHRPLECSLLKCWAPEELEKIAGRKLLSRHDIIARHEPVLPFIKEQNDTCSLENLDRLLGAVHHESTRHDALTHLTGLVNTDLAIRARARARLHCSLALELFFFGRPLFIILHQFGIETHEENGVCRLSLPATPASASLAKSCE